ncbi:MAG: GNAT family N-acetyltransferase [Firmicutes bacterium]|nr:GNAT family N-acetyltransferase [Bacillota bacterium]
MGKDTIERCHDYERLTDLWLASVRATHDFLTEEDLEYYHRRIPCDYMPNVELYAVRNSRGAWAGFVGISGSMIEMLFVHPDDMGKGTGSMLLRFAMKDKGMRKVDVNEQNHRALRFYLAHGFNVTGRDATDCEGKPYPILHLAMKD